MSKIQKKLSEMGITLPEPLKPIGSYVPALQVGDLVYTSGHLPIKDGKLAYTGKVGTSALSVEDGAEASKLCILNALSSINNVIGDLERITKIVKLTGFVQSADNFSDQPKVINGASDLLKELFGDEIGSHVRSALGVNELPVNASVEIELIVQVCS